MSLHRPRRGELIALCGAVALLIVMFLPWDGSRTAWQSDPLGDAFQALAIVAALALVLATVIYDTPAVPLAAGVWTTIAGLAAAASVLERVISSTDLRTAAWVGLAAAIAIPVGGWASIRDETPPARLLESDG